MIIMSLNTKCDETSREDNTVLICLRRMILNSSMSDYYVLNHTAGKLIIFCERGEGSI